MENFRKIDNQEEWQELLNKTLFKTFFHTLKWESFLEKEYPWLKFERYVWQDKALISLAKYEVSKDKERLVSHPFCEYGGFLPLIDDVSLKDFEQDFKNDFSNFSFTIKTHPYFINQVQETERETYFIEELDKKNIDQLWRDLRKTTRHEITKAKNQGLQIIQCNNQKDLKAFYNLYIGKAKQHKVPAYPYAFFKEFLKRNDAEIILAKQGKQVVAGSAFLKYDKVLQYFINASKKGVRGANHLIIWTQLGKYNQKEFEIFDFGGTKKGSSLAVFKKGWGAKPRPVYVIGQSKRSQTSGIKRILWGYLPKFAIKILSPYFVKYKL